MAAEYKNVAVSNLLFPHYKGYVTTLSEVCPECLDECLTACKDIQSRLDHWAGTVKGDYFRDLQIVETYGIVEYKGQACDNPHELEIRLRLYAAQKGGNALVNFFWDKVVKRESNRVEAGRGPQGNPYYRTETRVSSWFTGYATAVSVVPFQKRAPSPKKMASGPINQQVERLVLDGLNICCWGAQEKAALDLRILLTLCTELAGMKIPTLVFFDANTPNLLHRRPDGDAYRAYDILKKHGVFVEVPGGISADEFILLRADREGSHVISNDQFRDFSKLYSWVSDGGRLIKGAVAGAKLTIPQLDIDVPILPNALLTAESLIA
jgi:hypothetical protein